MANLIEYIQSQVYENSTEDISGSIMQQVLTRMASDEGVVNVHTISGQTPFADYNNAQAARDAVPAGFKKLGLIITYKLSSGWYIDEFIGSATSGWSTSSNWKCLGPISVSQNASTGKTTITIGSESFDVATQPVSVSQNTGTKGINVQVGNGETFDLAKQSDTVELLNRFGNPQSNTINVDEGVTRTYQIALEYPLKVNQPFSVNLSIADNIVNTFRLYVLFDGDADYTMINQYCKGNFTYKYTYNKVITKIQLYITGSNAIGTGSGNVVIYGFGDDESLQKSTESVSKMVGAILTEDDFEFGHIDINTNQEFEFNDSASRVRTKTYHHLSKGTVIKHNDYSTFKLLIGIIDVNGYHYGTGWVTTDYTMPYDGDVVIVIATNSGAAKGTIEDYIGGLSIDSVGAMSEYVKTCAADYNNREIGRGNLPYYGTKRVQLDLNENIFNCKTNNIYRETYGEGNPMRYAQSMAYANDRIFVFGSDNYCTIYVMSDMENNKTRVALPFDASHWNNAQFSDVYVNGNSYPLLLLTRGDYPTDERSTDLYLVQITEGENYSYTFSIYKTIHNTIPQSVYNGSWVADWAKKKLYLYTFERGIWSVKDNNDTIFIEFELPDISSQEDVTLTPSDVLRVIHFPHYTMQGMTIQGGLLFSPGEDFSKFNGNSMWLGYNRTYGDTCAMLVIDLASGDVLNYIPTGNIENEGIFIKDNKIYLMSHNWTASVSTDVVFRIDEYDFSLPLLEISQDKNVTGALDWGISINIPANSTFNVKVEDNSGAYGDNALALYFNYGDGAKRVGDIKPNNILHCRTSNPITEIRLYKASSSLVHAGTITMSIEVVAVLNELYPI